jgi:hypothetical protein
MAKSGLEKNYVSKIDRFIQELEQNNPPSSSQQREMAKHERLARLRDEKAPVEDESTLWKEF